MLYNWCTLCPRFPIIFLQLQKTDDDQKQNVFPQPKEKSGDDGSLAIMKNKEIISLDIPLNESGSAGLGVSVKGKTMTTEEGTKDLGIFIKSVIHGGAASKVRMVCFNNYIFIFVYYLKKWLITRFIYVLFTIKWIFSLGQIFPISEIWPFAWV